MEMSVNSFGLEFRGPWDRKSSKQDNMAGHTLDNKVVLDCESLSVRPMGKKKNIRPGNESQRSAEKQTRLSRRLFRSAWTWGKKERRKVAHQSRSPTTVKPGELLSRITDKNTDHNNKRFTFRIF